MSNDTYDRFADQKKYLLNLALMQIIWSLYEEYDEYVRKQFDDS